MDSSNSNLKQVEIFIFHIKDDKPISIHSSSLYDVYINFRFVSLVYKIL